jgi:methyl-accepting chemotaxis protein
VEAALQRLAKDIGPDVLFLPVEIVSEKTCGFPVACIDRFGIKVTEQCVDKDPMNIEVYIAHEIFHEVLEDESLHHLFPARVLNDGTDYKINQYLQEFYSYDVTKVYFAGLRNTKYDNLLTIAQTSKANGSVDDFLQDYTSNLRNSNFSSIASGIFPTLGILGTFISIALSMPDFTSNNIAALDSEITKLLSGVGTAFYVSIYGIFLSIWWIFFEKFGLSRFHHDSYIIKESTKNFFWTKIDIESIHIKSNIDNFSSMSKIFAELTSSQAMYDINRSIEQRAKSIDELLQKEYMLSLRIDENIANFEKLASAVEKLSLQSNSQTMIFKDVSDNLNKNILELNSHMNNLSSENLKAIYTNIVKSIETMKSDMEKIEWKFEEGLKESLRQIDLQTANIVKDLTIFKDLSK